MSLNSSKEDSDHLSKLQEQNGEEYEDAAEKVQDSRKRKGKQTKESIQRKQQKRNVGEAYSLSRFTRCVFSLSESTSSDSCTGKSISVVIFDLTLNERMNGLTCWMTCKSDINFHPTFLQHLSNISSNMFDKMLNRFN